MTAPAVILSLLFGTALVMTIAMGVAWLHFGRQRHVLTWAASYGVAILQWIANAGGFFLHSRLLYILTGVGLIISASLLAIGVQQRSGRQVRITAFAVPAMLVIISMSLAIGPVGSQIMQGMIIPAYVGVLLAVSALSLWPRDRAFTPPELAFFTVLLAFALGQLALALSASLIRGPEEGKEVYRAILGLVMPTIYVGTGVAAVLVVAGDLAQQLRQQMRHDPLTNVLNRRGIEEFASRAIATARRQARPLSLVICDLDGFKALNDSHGHIAGDTALRSFAQLLTNAVRRGDVVGRLGGDEFGLLLIDAPAQVAAEVMERVRMEISCLRLDEAPHTILCASFGVADLRVEDARLEDMLARADSALYDAKRAGKNQVSIWCDAA
ncbi:GGDEF domain-containing protein [Sphingobium sp. AP49]|uniref:GGDEF domain-containing protein n=1 Tax=Sphingobium sp. AP49 TaxID=1144307 RepID=UPI00026ED30D|nr:GGDEF domain-containing protein [Sphingobium sp. AP49]WHO37202.1 GGDEF domain-containing protein [Sphingobium sp. AP49]